MGVRASKKQKQRRNNNCGASYTGEIFTTNLTSGRHKRMGQMDRNHDQRKETKHHCNSNVWTSRKRKYGSHRFNVAATTENNAENRPTRPTKNLQYQHIKDLHFMTTELGKCIIVIFGDTNINIQKIHQKLSCGTIPWTKRDSGTRWTAGDPIESTNAIHG